MAPLVLTLAVDPRAQAFFDRLRREHFPPGRNHLAAHVTLFHQLPGQALAPVRADVEEAVQRPAYDVAVTGVRLLGRGVAYALRSAETDVVRAELARRWEPSLTAQDRRPSALHVTVQNKVAPEVARGLYADLAATGHPGSVRACGLDLWRYLGGPWELLSRHRFTSP